MLSVGPCDLDRTCRGIVNDYSGRYEKRQLQTVSQSERISIVKSEENVGCVKAYTQEVHKIRDLSRFGWE